MNPFVQGGGVTEDIIRIMIIHVKTGFDWQRGSEKIFKNCGQRWTHDCLFYKLNCEPLVSLAENGNG